MHVNYQPCRAHVFQVGRETGRRAIRWDAGPGLSTDTIENSNTYAYCFKLHSRPQDHLRFSSGEMEQIKEWLVQLPKVLWEVGSGDPVLTEVRIGALRRGFGQIVHSQTVLRLLLRIVQRRSQLFDMNVSSSSFTLC